MTTQPEALRLAEFLESKYDLFHRSEQMQAADELRRLQAALEMNTRTIAMYENEQLDDEALLRRALTVMEESHYAVANAATHNDVMEHFAVIEALRERLGVSE